MSNACNLCVIRVGIDIEAADTHYSVGLDCEKENFAEAFKAIAPRMPVGKQSVEKIKAGLSRLVQQSVDLRLLRTEMPDE